MHNLFKNTYYTVLLSISFVGNAQMRYKPQTWNTSCWAATTENVFSSSRTLPTITRTKKECDIIFAKDQSCTWCLPTNQTPPDRGNFLIDNKTAYMNILKQYCSFEYVSDGQHTLSWSTIKSVRKPIICSFNISGSRNISHFVNICESREIGGMNWLYIFDPIPTTIGTYYLKNYDTYQRMSESATNDLQTTYYNFGQRKRSGSSAYLSTSNGLTSSIPATYDNFTPASIRTKIINVLNSAGPKAQEITGLIRAIAPNIIVGNIVIPLDTFKTQTIGVNTVSVVINSSKFFVAPIFKDSANILKFVSIVILMKKMISNSTIGQWDNLTIDRIQKLNLPDDILSRLLLPAANVAQNGIIQLPAELFNFNVDENGRMYLKKGDEYFDISLFNSKWVTLGDIYMDSGNAFISNPNPIGTINREIFDKNPTEFSQILNNKGLTEIKDGVQYLKNESNSLIKLSDFQKQFQNNSQLKNVIIFKKN